MKKNIRINLIDLLSLLLVISFFIFHNIYLVHIGILLAYYQINKNKLKFIPEKKQVKIIKNEEEIDSEIIKNEEEIHSEIIKKSNEDLDDKACMLTLVEVIEEFGYIPRTNRKDDRNAA